MNYVVITNAHSLIIGVIFKEFQVYQKKSSNKI